VTAPRRVSVVIPAYYSVDHLGDCLEALRAQTYPDHEVIVVNSSPERRTKELVTGGYPEVIFEQSNVRLLPHAARNRGVSHARGELIVFTDPDCVPRASWIENLVSEIDTGRSVVQGSMDLADLSWLSEAIHLVKWHGLLKGNPAGTLTQVATGNACIRRDVWESTGPFAGAIFAGDALLSWRASVLGHVLWFAPRAVVAHRHPEGVRAHLRERFHRGLEFGRLRTSFWGWSRRRSLLYALAFPLLPLVVLVRAARSAARNGWLLRYVATFPVQLLGQAAWCAGEATACLEHTAAGRLDA